jgi:hypothetical protein
MVAFVVAKNMVNMGLREHKECRRRGRIFQFANVALLFDNNGLWFELPVIFG